MAKRGVITLPGSRGINFTVCKCHAHLVDKYKWHVLKSGHVARSIWSAPDKKKTMVYIHRIIAGTPKGIGTDHQDNDPTNNMCWNLRIASQFNNVGNSRISRRNTSGYKGVSWHKQSKMWRAYIFLDSRQKSLGLFKSKDKAAIAVNEAAIEKWGPFAHLNRVAKPKK